MPLTPAEELRLKELERKAGIVTADRLRIGSDGYKIGDVTIFRHSGGNLYQRKPDGSEQQLSASGIGAIVVYDEGTSWWLTSYLDFLGSGVTATWNAVTGRVDVTIPGLGTHHLTHENGGADEIAVAGLSGLLADDQHVLDAEVIAAVEAEPTLDLAGDVTVAVGKFLQVGGKARIYDAYLYPDYVGCPTCFLRATATAAYYQFDTNDYFMFVRSGVGADTWAIFIGGVNKFSVNPTNAVLAVPLNMGNQKITDLAAATAANDALRYGQVNGLIVALGDILYGSAAGTLAKLAGNTTTTLKALTQTGDGAASAAPAWNTLYSHHQYVFSPDAAPGVDVDAGDQQGTIHHSGPNGDTATRLYVDCETAPGGNVVVTIERAHTAAHADCDDLDTADHWHTVATITSTGKSTYTDTIADAAVPANVLLRMNVTSISTTKPKDMSVTLRTKRTVTT